MGRIILVFLVLLFLSIITNTASSSDIDQTVEQLERLSGCELFITSGLRTPEENKKVGGAKHSYHLIDQARDLVPKNKKCISIKKLGILACNITSTIIYPKHIHIDSRDKRICTKGFYKKILPKSQYNTIEVDY